MPGKYISVVEILDCACMICFAFVKILVLELVLFV